MIYFSHLDLLRLLYRALRRTSLPIVYTSGFNPHPKISSGNALKLGKEGPTEVKFYFCEKIEPEEFKEIFQKELPPGLKIEKIEK